MIKAATAAACGAAAEVPLKLGSPSFSRSSSSEKRSKSTVVFTPLGAVKFGFILSSMPPREE